MSQKKLGINELIERVKEELLIEQDKKKPKLFRITEITLEINFAISGDINSGFDLGVVTLGSEVSEERIQKVTIKLDPINSEEAKKIHMRGDQ